MALKPKQRALAELMVLEPKLINTEYADRIGIDIKTVYKWKKLPEFQEYIHELSIEKFRDMESLAIEKLKENVNNNNQKAIEYALDYLGYKASQKVEADLHTDIVINIE
jgi:hypothetical protein